MIANFKKTVDSKGKANPIAKEILNAIGAVQATTDKERAMISIAYHGVSLTDVYWIKADGE